MNHYENKEVKKYLILILVLGVLAAVMMAIVIRYQCERQRKLENAAVYALLQEVEETAPQADMERLLDVLNDTQNYQDSDAARFRRQYGLIEEESVLYHQAELRTQTVILSVVVMAAAESLLIGIFLFYLSRRRKKIEVLSDYMERISMGHFDLDISDNSEDELSNLKNQLFKLMVMLREQADVAASQKKVLAESVSDISHQLKTPLTSAMILLDNLTDHPEMDEKMRKKFLLETARQVDSMKWMIVSMLKLSRLDAGMVEMEEEPFSVAQMVKSGIESLGVLTDLAGVSVELCCPQEQKAATTSLEDDEDQAAIGSAKDARSRAFLRGDLHWNREAFINLLKNAVEHSAQGDVIRVTIEANDVYVAISVANRGEPFSREQEKNMFRRYYSEANSPGDNAGIGLPLTKAILERQHGYLTVESDAGWNIFTMKYLKNY